MSLNPAQTDSSVQSVKPVGDIIKDVTDWLSDYLEFEHIESALSGLNKHFLLLKLLLHTMSTSQRAWCKAETMHKTHTFRPQVCTELSQLGQAVHPLDCLFICMELRVWLLVIINSTQEYLWGYNWQGKERKTASSELWLNHRYQSIKYCHNPQLN